MRINKANLTGGIAEPAVSEAPNRITLPSGKKITLNEQQVEALEKMSNWLDVKDDFFFTLSGPAGSGKTTITLQFINIFKDKNRWARMAVSAPTHKARKVIGRATKEDAYTIQKLLGLRPNTELENYNINNPQFDELAEKQISGLKLLIIDEASMLNEALFHLIVKEAKNYRVKVLFLGDQFQLPPVNESISKIFTDVATCAFMTKVERQKGSNPLMGVYDLIRSDISSQTDLFEHRTTVNELGEGIVFHKTQKAMEAEILPMFRSQEYQKDPDYIKFITYSNASVQAWNKRIRDNVFAPIVKDGASQPLESLIEGDILLAYNTVMEGRDSLLIENSSDYKVHKVGSLDTTDGIGVWEVVIRSVDENLKSTIRVVRPDGISRFLSRHERLLNVALATSGNGRKFAWKNYYDFKSQHLLMNDIQDGYGRLLVKKDLDYGYAQTVHKSQGSTFVNVAVSENNLDTNKSHEERNKLKYVAFSRPTTRAIVLSNKA